MSAGESGIKVYGEQRGDALSDINGDGKIDLALAQNEGPLKLYLNRAERSGITVELQGPPQNPAGIGANMRLIYADGTKGALREVQAGSGYWSQHSPTQILGADSTKTVHQIDITWPDKIQQMVEVDHPREQEKVIVYPDPVE